MLLETKCVVFFKHKHFFGQKHSPPRFRATIVNLPNNAWVQNNLEHLAQ